MNLIKKTIQAFLSGNFCRGPLMWALFLLIANSVFGQALPDISYPTPNVYNINTPITPLKPTNNGGTVPGNVYGQVSTFAILAPAIVPNGTGSSAFFSTPNALNFDASGNLYVADANTKQIWKITPAGDVTTFAGTPGVSGSLDGPALTATFGAPTGVVVDSKGNVFVADFTGNTIRKITTVGAVSIVSTFAGSSTVGSADGNGNVAQFNKPYGLAIDANDNIYVADQGNNTIRKITPAGDVTTLAGSPTAFGSSNGQGTAATFRGPTYVAVNALGSVYVVDAVNNLIRAISPAGKVSTVSITNLSTTGSINGLRVDAAGNLYFVALRNQIFKLTNTQLFSLAGNLSGGSGALDGVGSAAFFNKPADLVFDNAGNIYIADQNNNRIRKLTLTGYTIDKALPPGLLFDATTGVISGTPTVAFQSVTFTITAYNKGGSSSTTVDIAVNGLPVPPKILAPNISYASPVTYNPGVPITPLQPINTGGAVPATIYGTMTDMASGFNYAWGVATDPFGAIYVCDYANNQIKKIDPVTHGVTVFAGSTGGAQGYNNGPANTALFWSPSGIALDAFGNVYVADQGSNAIRKITPGGVVSTLAGSSIGAAGDQPGVGSDARFNAPRGLAIDANDNLYVADFGNNVVKKIDTKSGLVSYIYDAGPLKGPSGVGIDASGVLYIADADNNRIQKVANGAVTTLSIPAGTLKSPREVRIDGTGNVYITDQLNHRVLRISPTNVVTPIAYFSTTQTIIGAVLDGLGNLYIGDNAYKVIKIVVSGYEIDKPLPAGLSFDQKTGVISGTPTSPSLLQPYVITAYNGGGSNSFTLNLEVANISATTITFGNPALKTNLDNTVTVSVASNNTEATIQYTSSNPAVISVDANNVLHRVGPGTVTITASQVATAHYFAGTATHTETLKLSQKVVFPPIATKTICSADFLSGATSVTSAPYPITYISSNLAVATVNAGGIIHIVGIGATTITASEPGDANLYDDATPQSRILTVSNGIQPTLSVTPGSNPTCTGSSVTFTANVTNLSSLTNPSYQWQVNGNNVGANSNTYTVLSIASTDVIKCTVTNNTACPASNFGICAGFTVTPTALTLSIISSATGAICPRDSITFKATPNTGSANVIYQWHLNGNNVGTNSATYTDSTFVNGDIVTCTVTNNSTPCLISNTAPSNSLTVSVTSPAGPAPTVSIKASAIDVYESTAITFTADPQNTVGNITYHWQVNGKNAATNSPLFTSNTFLNRDKVTCTVFSGGCTAPATSNEVTLTIKPPLKIIPSNTFTPNGDGINDLWTITGLFSYPNCVVNVYNRSGQLVYQSRGYAKPWDGIYKGSNLPVGTYYYVIDLSNNKPKVSGYIAIIR